MNIGIIGAGTMGPLHLADLIGLDVCWAIMQIIYSDTQDEKYRPAALLEKMVAEQKLGKQGKDFLATWREQPNTHPRHRT